MGLDKKRFSWQGTDFFLAFHLTKVFLKSNLVLSTETGYKRNYSIDPYDGYEKTSATFFPVNHLDKTYHAKEWTLAIQVKGQTKLYPLVELVKKRSKKNHIVEDKVLGRTFQIVVNPISRDIIVYDKNGRVYPSFTGYWFALRAFYHNANVYHAP